MSNTKKMLLGMITIMPLLCLLAYMVLMFTMILSTTQSHASHDMPIEFIVMMGMVFFMMLLIFGLLTFYIIHAFNNQRIPQDQKVLWVILIFFGNFVAMPIYWYLFIWKDAPAATPPPPG